MVVRKAPCAGNGLSPWPARQRGGRASRERPSGGPVSAPGPRCTSWQGHRPLPARRALPGALTDPLNMTTLSCRSTSRPNRSAKPSGQPIHKTTRRIRIRSRHPPKPPRVFRQPKPPAKPIPLAWRRRVTARSTHRGAGPGHCTTAMRCGSAPNTVRTSSTPSAARGSWIWGVCASRPMTPTTTSRSFAALVQRLAVARDPVQGPRARFERPGVHGADDGKRPLLPPDARTIRP